MFQYQTDHILIVNDCSCTFFLQLKDSFIKPMNLEHFEHNLELAFSEMKCLLNMF